MNPESTVKGGFGAGVPIFGIPRAGRWIGHGPVSACGFQRVRGMRLILILVYGNFQVWREM